MRSPALIERLMADPDDTRRLEARDLVVIPLVAETVRGGRRFRTTAKVRVRIAVDTQHRTLMRSGLSTFVRCGPKTG